jgi:hypothetical protein
MTSVSVHSVTSDPPRRIRLFFRRFRGLTFCSLGKSTEVRQ